ncbi:tetratricopeptide repeat protein [Arenimonas sp. GDDSR-1]|uniref:SirB1 family protein n=1 Tax=Arenimonas sp. GDDSR-1 TaxID=2950125 RepID=UPI0026275A46|nr:tetratricopeptide repeat protein [Arenimonas sp. GDDSR-1]
MAENAGLPDWNRLATLSDAELPLLETALLIARDEYPELETGAYLAMVDGYGRRLSASLSEGLDIPSKLTAINHFLYKELGFSGNARNYEDPRNSYLNQVFDRRLGIPISLAVVHIAVMHRIGLPLEGISFPGHFLVRLPVDDGILVLDPFNQGRPVSIEELRERVTPHLDGLAPSDSQLFQILAPATARTILMRMLRNLQTIYQHQGDFERVARSADRILKLSPDLPEALRDRGFAYAEIGYRSGANADLTRYLQLRPDAEDADGVRNLLIEAAALPKRLN